MNQVVYLTTPGTVKTLLKMGAREYGGTHSPPSSLGRISAAELRPQPCSAHGPAPRRLGDTPFEENVQQNLRSGSSQISDREAHHPSSREKPQPAYPAPAPRALLLNTDGH